MAREKRQDRRTHLRMQRKTGNREGIFDLVVKVLADKHPSGIRDEPLIRECDRHAGNFLLRTGSTPAADEALLCPAWQPADDVARLIQFLNFARLLAREDIQDTFCEDVVGECIQLILKHHNMTSDEVYRSMRTTVH